MISRWLRVMLEDIGRKRIERDAALAGEQRRQLARMQAAASQKA